MRNFYVFLFSILIITSIKAGENVEFYIKKALQNNLELNAERKNFESAKQNKNILRSEFLPSITVSGEQSSLNSTSRTDQNGNNLADSNSDSQSQTISLEQKIFTGFKGYNTFKKSELETKRAKLNLKKVEQNTIFNTASAYFDLIYKSKNEIFNLSNVDLFERQVESDSARLQKGEITLTDLAQSESSLAGANAKLIKAKTELLSSIKNFERETGEKIKKYNKLIDKVILDLPSSLNRTLELSNLNNVDFLIAGLDHEIASKQLEIEKARLSPSASFKISKTENRDFSSSIDKKDDEILKATITWPIIKGGENISSIKKSSFEKERAKLILKDNKNKLAMETSNSWSNYTSSKSVLEATKSQLRAAEIANEGITLEYDSGSSRTTLEVIQSRSLLLDARISHAKAERDFMISQFDLAKQIGTLSLKSIK